MYGIWEDSEAVVEYKDQEENDESQDSKLYASAYLPRGSRSVYLVALRALHLQSYESL